MARITVEDCLENVDNRFELVMVASKRARQLATKGADANIEWENDKATVVALREIAEGYVDASILDEIPPVDLLPPVPAAPAAEAGAEVEVEVEVEAEAETETNPEVEAKAEVEPEPEVNPEPESDSAA